MGSSTPRYNTYIGAPAVPSRVRMPAYGVWKGAIDAVLRYVTLTVPSRCWYVSCTSAGSPEAICYVI